MPGLTIIGSGRYLPGPPVPNDRLARVMDTNDAWIRQRTGIHQRHFAPKGVAAADLAHEASKRALENAGLEAKDVDYILLATMTPDYIFPGSGALLGSRLGTTVPALDIRQQCAAVLFGLQVANGLMASGQAETVLFVGAEAHAGFMPWNDWDVLYSEEHRRVPDDEYDTATRHRGIAIIFGDGAGALVLRKSNEPSKGIIGTKIVTDGSRADHLYIRAGFRERPYLTGPVLDDESWIPHMNGREVFKTAVTMLPKAAREVCAEHGFRLEDVDYFIAHQANDRINQLVRQSLGVPEEKVPSNIAKHGNTSAATIPILMDEMRRDGRLREGQLLCLLALGAGLHWGAQLLRT